MLCCSTLSWEISSKLRLRLGLRRPRVGRVVDMPELNLLRLLFFLNNFLLSLTRTLPLPHSPVLLSSQIGPICEDIPLRIGSSFSKLSNIKFIGKLIFPPFPDIPDIAKLVIDIWHDLTIWNFSRLTFQYGLILWLLWKSTVLKTIYFEVVKHLSI